MGFLRHLRTTSKLGLIIGISAAALLAVGLVADFGLSQGSAAATTLYERDMKGLIALETAQADFIRVRVEARGVVVFAGQAERVAACRTRLESLRGSILAQLDKAEPTLIEDEARRAVAETRQHIDSYYRLLPEFFAAAAAADPQRLGQAMSAVEPDIRSIGEQIELLVTTKMAVAEGASREVQQSLHQGRVIVWALVALGGGLALVVSLLVARSIARPIAEALGVLQQVAEGDLTARMEGGGSDELAQMAAALDAAIGSLSDAFRSIAESAQTLASSSEELSSVSRQMGASSDETSRQATSVSAASEQVSANIQTVAGGTEEMGASIREIAKRASEASRIATSAVEMARDTNEIISKLDLSSNEVGNVVRLITTIAEQTNLLALNATIEAARAGEAGKGFAVVAGEVKELAKQTARATEEISAKIAAIQGDTKGAVSALGEITAIIGQINDIETTIAGAVEQQAATTQDISRNVGEAAGAAREIASNISGVARSASTAAEGVEQTRTAASELARMASELQGLVARFRYEERPAGKQLAAGASPRAALGARRVVAHV